MHEKRRYVRMNTVFPVELEVFSASGEKLSRALLQGFTRDVSEGGICVELKSFGKETEKLFSAPGVRLRLTINPPFAKHPILAQGEVAWMHRPQSRLPVQYRIGIHYTQIDPKGRTRIIRYAKRLQWLPRLTVATGLIMLAALLGLYFHDQHLTIENRRLVKDLVASAERKTGITTDLEKFDQRKVQLEKQLAAARDRIKTLESSVDSMAVKSEAERQSYQEELTASINRQKRLEQALEGIRQGQQKLEAKYLNLREAEKMTASAGLRQMYGWLRSHQNLRTGLVASFEGDGALEDWAFTYDQSLACQTFLLFRDFKDAEAILSFYQSRAERSYGVFSNAYDTTDGRPVENTVHVGPNVWLGLAALQYENRVRDGRFLPLARQIGDWLITQQDAEGGLKGGPEFSWYSTEHNLDAYAFFRMLHEITGEERYGRARQQVLAWIKKYAYSVKERRMNRGKGDATIATDTFSWAIAAIGPETLKQMDLDPEEIMDYAEKNCEVKVDFSQPGRKPTSVRGFDFAKAEHVGRGGVISTEWTSQAIVTYQVLADHLLRAGQKEKADRYLNKSYFYLNELQKLIITSPSRTGQGRGCLPYASADDVDTGHGWRTPKGPQTGSVAGTAYGIFAWTGYNPFDLKQRKEVD